MDPSKHRIAAKIAKLLRRAEREDGHEAETALKMAHDLMSRHGIEVELHEFDEGPTPVFGERMVMFSRDRDRDMWAQFLLQQLAPVYHCVNRQEQVDAGWAFYIVGPPGQIEPGAAHFEYLVSQIRFLGATVYEQIRNPFSFPSQRVVDGVQWGIMDALLQTLNKRASANPPVGPMADANVVVVSPRLALLPAEHLAVRGTEIAPCAPGETPFGMGFSAPPDVDAGPPPYWAWQEGFRAGQSIDPDPPQILYRPLGVLDLSERVVEILRQEQVHTVAQLVRLRPVILLSMDGIDHDDAREIVARLAEHRLFLATESTGG